MKKEVISLHGPHPSRLWIKAIELIKFTLTRRLYIALIILITIFLLYYSGSQATELWKNFIDEIEDNNTGTIFNLVSLLFILAIWFNNIIKDWQNTLPKYLSVEFFCDNDCNDLSYLADQYALLISDADIRSLAQQIGQQKNNNLRLNLDSTRYKLTKTLSFSYGLNAKLPCSSAFWHYAVKIHLRTPPAKEKEYLSQEEYFDSINTSLKSLQEKTAKDYETDFVAETKKLLNFQLAQKFGTNKQ